MSWQAYVDSNLVGTGNVTKAAIHGLDGNPWATSSGFSVQPAEAQRLISGVNDPSPFYSGGFDIAGEKYRFLRHEAGRSIYGKRGADAGCVVVKTGQCILICVFEAGIQAGNAAKTVEGLADYLVENGY